MDFHSLTRKELQTLCKRNKIPANITNVAMADALTSLEIVEGLDELLNQSKSPEKTMNQSVTGTSTRAKTTKEEPQSTQPKTQTRRTARRTIELDEENKNVNVPETPVMATATAAMRRPGVGSTRRKDEAQKEVSVQQSIGTRRSVRLLEKCMSGLSLKENEKVEPMKMGEMVENEVEENKNIGQSEVPLARNLSVSLEDERDTKEDVVEIIECDHKSEAASDKSDNLDAKDASPNVKTDAYLADKSADKLPVADVSDGTIEPKGPVDVAVSDSEIDNSNEELVTDETKSIEVVIADTLEEISEETFDHSSPVEEYQAPPEIEYQKPVGKDCDASVVMVNDDLPKRPEAQEYDEVSENEASEDDEGVENEASGDDSADQTVNGSKILSDLEIGYDNSSEADDDNCSVASELLEEVASEEKQKSSISTAAYSSDSEDSMSDLEIDDDTESDNSSLAEEPLEEVSCEEKRIFISMSDIGDEEALVDVNVAEAEAETIIVVESSFNSSPEPVAEKTLVDVCVKAAEEFEEITPEEKNPIVSNNKENFGTNSTAKEDEIKKNKKIIEEEIMQNLERQSLRSLRKMLGNLQINDKKKNKEDKSTRAALQKLEQNCMSTGEAEKHN